MADLEDEERRLREEVLKTQRSVEESLQQKDSEIEETRKALKKTQAELNEKRNNRLDLDIGLGDIIKKIRQSGTANLSLITGFTTDELCEAVDQWCDIFDKEISDREGAHTAVVGGMRDNISKEASETILLDFEKKQLKEVQARNFKELDLDRSILFPVIKPQVRIVSRYDITTTYPSKAPKKLPPLKSKDEFLVACYHNSSQSPSSVRKYSEIQADESI